MNVRVAGGTKSKAQTAATAINRLLAQLAGGPPVDCALVGYRSWPDGQPDVGCRWQGPLAGCGFVSTSRLADAPLAIEERVRKVPSPGGVGPGQQETVKFPVWYVPELGGPLPVEQAVPFCRQLLRQACADQGPPVQPPLVIHLVGDTAPDFQTPDAFEAAWDVPCGKPIWLCAHLATSDRIPPVLYPSSDRHLPSGPVRGLFQMASEIPEPLAGSLRSAQVPIGPRARGLIYNARMTDLIRLLSVVPTCLATQAAGTTERAATPEMPAPKPAESSGEEKPSAAASEQPAATLPVSGAAPTGPPSELTATGLSSPTALFRTAPGERPGEEGSAHIAGRLFCLMLLDRSAQEPAQAGPKTPFARLQEEVNRLLGRMARRDHPGVDVGLLAYGASDTADVELSDGLDRPIVPAGGLAGAALRSEQVVEKVPNGIGGLVEVNRQRLVFVDLAPTAAVSPVPALAAAGARIARWAEQQEHGSGRAIVIHFTRAQFDPQELREAVEKLHAQAPVPVYLYHVVATETPHRSVSYPPDSQRMDTPELAALWQQTSPMAGREYLAARRPAVSPQSRGMVINARFDLLDEVIEAAGGKHGMPARKQPP
ncbi:MAG TPA: hypothetical protein EYP56_23125 [Planctomycetaceae bacterium]|nr:hypothetical protein [Planctomycetaceae bacterium]HIQ22944.1 hypothetical protein [Planctomycetota bacterium]